MSQVSLGQYYTPSELAEWMVQIAEGNPNDRVLEAGCGEGVFLEALLQAGYKNITGYDIDPANCQVVRDRFGSKVQVHRKNFLTASRDPCWDLLIGNPPYVSWRNMEEANKKILRNDPFWKQYSSGEWDLFYAFIIAGTYALRPGGKMVFVVPSNWMTATYAQPVREHLESGCFCDIVMLGEYRVFEDAAPDAMIFVWEKTASTKPVSVLDFQGRREGLPAVLQEATALRKKLPRQKDVSSASWHAYLSEQPQKQWRLASSSEKQTVKRIEKAAGLSIGDVAQIGVGFVSGLDRAFAVNARWVRSLDPPEKRFVRKFAKAKDCKRFQLPSTSYFIFVDEISSESDLRKLPNIYKHLLQFKQDLLARYGQAEWWRWATVRNRELFQKNIRKPKIFVPCTDRSARARFCITTKQIWGSGDVLMIAATKTDPWYLQAWLASSVWNHWHEISGPPGGGRRRYTQSLMRKTPFLPEDHWSPKQLQKIISRSKELSKNPSQALLLQNDQDFERAIKEA